MVKVIRLTQYTQEIATAMRGLIIELSRSGKDKGEIPQKWFDDVIKSPWHDVLLAIEANSDSSADLETGAILGMATVSIIMGAGIGKNAYLEDFVVTATARGKGVSALLWDEILSWSREKGARRLEFTCGHGRDAAQAFYRKHGADIYDTNFFRYIIEE